MTSTGKTTSTILLLFLLFGGTVTQAQSDTSTANTMDLGTLIVVITGIAVMTMSAFVVWRSMQDTVPETDNTQHKVRQTQPMDISALTNASNEGARNLGGGGGSGDSDEEIPDDTRVLVIILLDSPLDWWQPAYEWTVTPEQTPYYIGSTMNRISSMELEIGIPDRRVSGNHIRIDYREDINYFTFTDMNSVNGSEWDDDVMVADKAYMLQPDNKVTLVVSRLYKFVVSAMTQGNLKRLLHSDGKLRSSFLDDSDLVVAYGSAQDGVGPTLTRRDYDVTMKPERVLTPAITTALPDEVTKTGHFWSFDVDNPFDDLDIQSDTSNLREEFLPDAVPLPKEVDAYLIWHESDKPNTKLKNSVLTIGSSPMADITLQSDDVSDTHLILTWRDEGFFIFDVSREGTWLQKGTGQPRRRMPTTQWEYLHEGTPHLLDVARDIDNFTFEYKVVEVVASNPKAVTEPDTSELEALPEGVTPYMHIVREGMSDHRRDMTQLGNNIILGRDPSSTILLETNTVSRLHAQILWRDGGFVIRDMNSRGGTKVNDTLLIENDNLWLPLEVNEIHRILLSPGEQEVLVEFCYRDKRDEAVT